MTKVSIAENFKNLSCSALRVLEISVWVEGIEHVPHGVVGGASPCEVVFGPSFPVNLTVSLELCTPWVSGCC